MISLSTKISKTDLLVYYFLIYPVYAPVLFWITNENKVDTCVEN